MVDAKRLAAPEFELPHQPPFRPGESPFRVAGIVYKGLVAFVESHVTGGLAALRDDLSAELWSYVTRPRDLFAKYDAIPLPYIHQAAARKRGVGFEQQVGDSNRWSEAQHGTLYRAVLAVVSAQSVAIAVPRAAAIAQHFGRTTTRVVGPGKVEGARSGVPRTLVRWTGFASAHYLERALTRVGAVDPDVELGTPSRDGEIEGEATYELPFAVTWRA